MFEFVTPTLLGVASLVAGLYAAIFFAYASLRGKLDRILDDNEYLSKELAKLDRRVDEVPTNHLRHDFRQQPPAR